VLAESGSFADLNPQQRLHIADLIYANECNRNPDCLVAWNDGENFASMGIGHFIWFPQGSKAPFQESFPDLLLWFQAKGVVLPTWLEVNSPCPWQNQAEFNHPNSQAYIQDLTKLLKQTKLQQASFIMNRLQQSLPKILGSFPDAVEKAHLQHQFERVAASPAGWYVLADYVNFKGEGINPKERYHQQGWGLAQVLLHMQGASAGRVAIQDFADAAAYMLQRRVALSPSARNEKRWLAGWNKRLQTYVLHSSNAAGL